MVVSAEGNLHHSEQLLNEERYVTLSGQRLPVYCLLSVVSAAGLQKSVSMATNHLHYVAL